MPAVTVAGHFREAIWRHRESNLRCRFDVVAATDVVQACAMATQLDRIEAMLQRVDLQQRQALSLLNAISTGVQIMSQTADDTKAAVDTLDAKVETLIGLVQPSIQTLRDQLAAAQELVSQLQASAAADVTTLQATIAAAQAETANVQAAIDQLNPQTPPAG